MIGDNVENKLFNYRPLFEFALGMMAGILLCLNLAIVPLTVCSIVFAIGGTALYCYRLHRFAVFVLASLFGIVCASISMPNISISGNASVSGVVLSLDNKADGEAIILTVGSVQLNGSKFNKRARLTVKNSEESKSIKIGDIIEADAELTNDYKRFGTYDERMTLLSKGIGCSAVVNRITTIGEHRFKLNEALNLIKANIKSRIDQAFDNDSGIFATLLLGVRTELADDRAEAYRASGTAHLLAISGFHMGILVSAVSALINKRKRLLKLIVTIITVSIYCAVAEYTSGIVRAAIMAVCTIVAGLLEKRHDTLSALSLSAILILLVNPFQLYSIGFQFSFSAVFGIALFANSLTVHLAKAILPLNLSKAVAVCLSATVGTLMFQLRYYSSFTPYSVIANLIAVPAFSIVVIFGAISTILAFISPEIGAIIAVLPRSILFAVEKLLGLFANLPFASVEFIPPSMLSCIVFMIMLFCISEYTIRTKRKRLEYALPFIILFTFSYIMGIIET